MQEIKETPELLYNMTSRFSQTFGSYQYLLFPSFQTKLLVYTAISLNLSGC